MLLGEIKLRGFECFLPNVTELNAFYKSKYRTQCLSVKNWVLATNSNVLIPISLQHDGVHLWFQTILGCTDLGIGKF